jgi:hypothetical protein
MTDAYFILSVLTGAILGWQETKEEEEENPLQAWLD